MVRYCTDIVHHVSMCTQYGTVLYWHCTSCEHVYTVWYGIVLTLYIMWACVHSMVRYRTDIAHHVSMYTQHGTVLYWHCTSCEHVYTAWYGIIPTLHIMWACAHSMVRYCTDIAHHVSMCTQYGTVLYWHCTSCEHVHTAWYGIVLTLYIM